MPNNRPCLMYAHVGMCVCICHIPCRTILLQRQPAIMIFLLHMGDGRWAAGWGRGIANKHRTRTHSCSQECKYPHIYTRTGGQHLFLFVMTLRFCCEQNGARRKWEGESSRVEKVEMGKRRKRAAVHAIFRRFVSFSQPVCLHLLEYNLASAHTADGLLFCR